MNNLTDGKVRLAREPIQPASGFNFFPGSCDNQVGFNLADRVGHPPRTLGESSAGRTPAAHRHPVEPYGGEPKARLQDALRRTLTARLLTAEVADDAVPIGSAAKANWARRAIRGS